MERFENVVDSDIVIGNEVVVEQVLSSEPINAVKVPIPIELQDKEVEPTTSEQVITADKEFTGLGTVTVGAVTSDIDENITPRNIRGGVTILGIIGDLEPDKPDQNKSVEPSTSEQVVTADSGYELASVTVGAVTSEIDPNIKAENIKENESILGVVGTFKGGEDLDAEIEEQAELIAELESGVNELPNKPVDRLQYKCDNIKSLMYEFYCNSTPHYVTDEYVTETMRDIDTSNVIKMNYMFATSDNSYSMLTDLSGVTLNAQKCENMSYMFYRQGRLKKLPNIINTDNVNYMNFLFADCRSLTELSLNNFNTSSVTAMNSMFTYCVGLQQLDLSNFNTLSVTDLTRMFEGCSNLTQLNLSSFNTSNVTSMHSMFGSCQKLEQLDLSSFDTSNATDMGYMFNSCRLLKTILGNIDIIKSSGSSGVLGMFNTCPALENVTLKNIKVPIQIGSGTSYGTLLTDESIVNTFQELWDNTDNTLGGTRTLTMSTSSKARTDEIYVKLIDITDEMRAEDEYIDNKKPCVVCESTDEGAMTLKEYGISKNWNIA